MTIIIGTVLLGALVFVHELGHFLAARLCGVKVEAFSIGMGPVLFHKERRGTDWRVSLLPFGGYCAMKGEKDFEGSSPDADSFYGARPFYRAVIGLAGPLANFLFAAAAFFVIALTGYTYYAAGNTIRLASDVWPELHSAAADAGIQSGDKIIQINSKKITDFSEIYAEVAARPDEDISVTVERGGGTLTFTVRTDMSPGTGEGKIGVVSDPSSVEAREAARYSFFPAVGRGFLETFRMIHLSLKGIAMLFKGAKVTESVAGPARITQMMGETARSGFSAGFRSGMAAVLQFMALISVSLLIMNLLPIPILDGFLVITSIVEAIFGVRVSPKARNVVQYIGIALIAALFVLAVSGDFHYFAGLLHEK